MTMIEDQTSPSAGAKLILRSEQLLAMVDPSHGGELLELIDLRNGRQLLGRPPFSAAQPRRGELDEATWNASYRGGWQLSIPNVCNACTVEDRPHGYHGAGSVAPWTLRSHDGAVAEIAWEGHGLHVERRYALAGAELRVETEVRALGDEPAPFVALEHLVVGLELLDPEVTLRLPSAPAYEVDERDGPVRPPADALSWPHVRLLDGRQERADSWPIERPRSRWLVLHDVPQGTAEILNVRRGTGLALRWDAEAMPHLHVWHEAGASSGIWRGRTYVLGVEPANVPHGLGLAEAVRARQAAWVEPGRALRWWVALRAVHEGS
jgi:hypothetical protein